MKICLDAGHYGKYNQSPANKRYYESEVMWRLHLLLKKHLEAYGVEVVTTRTEQGQDMGLYNRGACAVGCGLFVSLHSNAVASSVNQSVDYPVSYCAIDKRADRIGLKLAKCIEAIMGTKQSARIEHRVGSNGDYYGVLRGSTAVKTPGLILEHSFHTHPGATEWLLDDNNLDRLAIAEADTIAEYYGIEKVVTPKYGWKEEDGGWRYYNGDTGLAVTNDWCQDVETLQWYWFDGAGLMVTNVWYEYQGHWYYLGSDGAMCKGLKDVNGNWYYLDTEGRMATKPFTLTPDKNGALQYPQMVK